MHKNFITDFQAEKTDTQYQDFSAHSKYDAFYSKKYFNFNIGSAHQRISTCTVSFVCCVSTMSLPAVSSFIKGCR